MNMKKLVVSLAVAGVMVSPLTQAAASLQLNKAANQLSVSQAIKAKVAKVQSDLFFINNTISLERAYQSVAGKSSGRLLGAGLNLGYGAPNYEFLLLEGDKLKYMVISGETAEVISEESFTDTPLFTPSVTLSQAIAAAESATSATAYVAELEQDETTGAYRVATGTNDSEFDVIVSASSGKVLMAVKESFDEADEGESDGEGDDSEPQLVSLSQAISAAEQAASGTVIGVNLDFGDDMDEIEDEWEDEEDDEGEWDDEEDDEGEWDDDDEGDWEDDDEGDWEDDDEGDDEGDDEDDGDSRWDDWGWWAKNTDGNSKATVKVNQVDENEDEGEAEEAFAPVYIVQLADGNYVHEVLVDATTGKVTEVLNDPEQALEAAIKAQTKWADTATVIANAKAAQAGHMEGMDLEVSEDGKLIYIVYIEDEQNSYMVIVDAAQGTVIKVETFDDEMDEEDEDDGEDAKGRSSIRMS